MTDLAYKYVSEHARSDKSFDYRANYSFIILTLVTQHAAGKNFTGKKKTDGRTDKYFKFSQNLLAIENIQSNISALLGF